MRGMFLKNTPGFGVYTALGVIIVSLVLSVSLIGCEEPAAVAPQDTTSPAEVTLAVNPQPDGSAEITWTDPTDADFSHIIISWSALGTTDPATAPRGELRVEKGLERAVITGLVDTIEYVFTAVSVDTAGNQSPTAAPVDVIADATPPAAVTDLTSVTGLGQVTLSWTDPADSDLSHILISWIAITSVTLPPAPLSSSLEVAPGIGTADIPLPLGEYDFTVTAVDTAGNQSPPQSARETASSDLTPPAAITLTAVPQANGAVMATWTEPPDLDFSHVLLSWTPQDGTTAQPLNVPRGTTSAIVPGLIHGTEYTFTVKSVDTSGNESPDSTEVRVTTDASVNTVTSPAAATAANSSIVLTWTDPTDSDFSHILISWSSEGGRPAQPVSVAKDAETATIAHLPPGDSIEFTIQSLDTLGNTADATVTQTPTPDTTPPAAVSDIRTYLVQNGVISFYWTNPTDLDFSHVLLSWTPSHGAPAQPLTIEDGGRYARITGLTDKIEYTFTAKSVDTTGNQSPDGVEVLVTADAAVAPVTNLAAAAAPNSGVTLTWDDPTESSFWYVRISWTPASGIPTRRPYPVTNGSETITISHLTPNVNVEFTVESLDALGHTAEASVTHTPAPDTAAPAVLTTLRATPQANGDVQVTWTDPPDYDFSHILLSWTPAHGTTTQPLRVAKGTRRATIPGLTHGTEYMFTAKSVDTLGNESAASAPATVTADAAVTPVTTLTATPAPGSAAVAWTDPTDSDLSHINITWSPADGSVTQPARVLAAVQTTFLTDLTPGTQYTVTVTAVDTLGHTSAETATVTPAAATAAAATGLTATPMTAAGNTTITWTDPSPATGITKLSITGIPAPTTPVEVALGTQTAALAAFPAPGVDHVITIAALDSTNAITSTANVTVPAATTARPIALYRLGGDSARHAGDFGFEACHNELTTGTGTVPAALRSAGYTRAVFFGTRTSAPTYQFPNIPTNPNALGINGATPAALEARPVVVYQDTAPSSPVTTFGTANTPRTIGSVLEISPRGAWRGNGFDVVGVLAPHSFWSFADPNPYHPGNCRHASSAETSDVGHYGFNRHAYHPFQRGYCSSITVVICAAH